MDLEDRVADIETKIDTYYHILVNAIHQLREVKDELQRLKSEPERKQEIDQVL